METVILENPDTFNDELYDDEAIVFSSWTVNGEEWTSAIWADTNNWDQLYTFQLLVREARKDEG